MNNLVISLGSDHGGFLLKEDIKNYLKSKNIECLDFGTDSKESVDYPLFAKKVSKSVTLKKANLGILCCGTGIGMSIAANKFLGIRAAVCTSTFESEMSRRHNDANILCLGARVLSKNDALNIVKKFINTEFDGGRHKRRLDQISQFESSSNLK